MTPPKHSALAYRDAKSDKVYCIDLQPSGDGFTVMAQNGRRGGTMTPQDKTPNGPIPYADAEKIFDRIVRTKMREGYQPYQHAANGSTPPAPQVPSAPLAAPCLMPELLDEITDAEAARLILSDDYYMQDKSDGHSRGIVKQGGKTRGINKTGQPVPLPAELVAELEQIGLASFQLDAELVGTNLVCRDLLEADGDITGSSYKDRFALLVAIIPPCLRFVSIVPTWAGTENKAAALAEQRDQNREGVVPRRTMRALILAAWGQDPDVSKYFSTKELAA